MWEKNVAMEVLTNEPDLANFFNYLVHASNELYPPKAWEGEILSMYH